MPRTPSPAKLYKLLLDLVKRMEVAEAHLTELGTELNKLKRWHEDTEFAKKLLKEYEDDHPEVTKQDSINTRALVAVLAALAALTTIIIAKFK